MSARDAPEPKRILWPSDGSRPASHPGGWGEIVLHDGGKNAATDAVSLTSPQDACVGACLGA